MKNLGLVPLSNFGTISEDREIYRCAQPLFGYQYAWLQKMLGIKHIINLRSEADIDKAHCELLGINSITVPVKDHNPPIEEQAKDYIKLIKGLEGPVIIHCEHGHGRTSTFSVLTKLALGQGFEEALADEKNRFHYEFKHKTQEEFLKNTVAKIDIQ